MQPRRSIENGVDVSSGVAKRFVHLSDEDADFKLVDGRVVKQSATQVGRDQAHCNVIHYFADAASRFFALSPTRGVI